MTDREALKLLKALALDKIKATRPTLPYPDSFVHDYKPAKANGLTRCIIDFIELNGGQAERISVTGRLIDGTKKVTDVLGNTRIIGSVSYIKSSMKKGSADISAIIRTKGKVVIPWKIEVKINKDKQSLDQKKYQIEINSAGGHYSIVKSLAEFIDQYENLINDNVESN